MSIHHRLYHVPSILIILTMLFSGISMPSAAAQGTLDPSNVLDASFGGEGIVITDFGGYELGKSLALQPDGKIIMTGSFYYDSLNQSHHDFALSRFNSNGFLDTTFDTDGRITLDLGGQEEAYDVALQSDGKIVVAGNSYTDSSSNFVLLRYNPNGSLDTTFGDDGKVMTNIIYGAAVAVQPDDRIVVAGHWYNGEKSGFSLVRFNSDGSLDTTFDGDGRVITYFANDAHGSEIAIQPDGKIVVIGYSYIGSSNYDFALARYNSNGSLDTTFHTDGKLTMDFGGDDTASAFAFQSDGKMVVVGTRRDTVSVFNEILLTRYNSNGSLDTTFDTDGKISLRLGLGDFGSDIALQPDGRILVLSGTAHASPSMTLDYDFALLRYNWDGSLDTTFDTDGKIILDLSIYDPADEIALQPDGKIVLSGGTLNADDDFALVRFIGDQPSRVVTKTADTNDGVCDSDCSLREAIYAAISGETIKFHSSLAGQTILLSSTLEIDKNLTIDGSGLPSRISISGNNSVGVLLVHLDFTVIIDSLIIKNGKAGQGAGIFNYGGTLTVMNSLLSGNHTEFDPEVLTQGYGGAIYSVVGDLTITGSSFDGNTGSRGGAIYCEAGIMTIVESTFLSNSVSSEHGDGGAIFDNCDSAVANSTFSSNVAEHTGGALLTDNDITPLVIVNSTFYDNTANTAGGIANFGGLIITNSTFSNNSSPNGGAIWNGLGGVLSLRNSILANSVGSVDCIKSDATPEVENINNLIETTGSNLESCGVSLLTSDPVLGPLQDNGGFTETMALEAGTPAVDAGSDANCPDYDQRGVARPQDDHCDLGAYEAQGTIEISIGGVDINSYLLAFGESKRISYSGVNSGPVKINNTNASSLIGAERLIYKANGVNTSFTEMMGLPDGQLDNVYWLPWYNNKDLDTQLRIANTTNTPTTVTVTIGGVAMTPLNLAAGESTRVSYPGVNAGPVKIESDQNIVVAERLIYKVGGVATSFSETMALPASQLDSTYWLPWYNNKDLDTQLRIANVTDNPATVQVTIGGVAMAPINLAAGESTRVSYPGVNAGPVLIESDQDIVAAERLIYKVNGKNTSFTEMMALPNSKLDNLYWLPWYNNKDLDTQLRIANVTDNPATVTVTIGGVAMPSLNLAAGESTRVSFAGVNAGPVQIVSDQNLVAAERLIYRVNGINTSFSEMMALPASQLDTTYWLPWYNNKDLDTQLRFAVP